MHQQRNRVNEIRFGEVPHGWIPSHWADHLEHLADSCEAVDEDKAGEYRRRAKEVRTNETDTD